MVKSSGGSGQKQNLCYRPTHDQTTRRRTQRSGQCRRTLWGPCGHAMPWATGFLPLPKNLANKQTASNDDTRTCLENEMEIGDAAAAAVGRRARSNSIRPAAGELLLPERVQRQALCCQSKNDFATDSQMDEATEADLTKHKSKEPLIFLAAGQDYNWRFSMRKTEVANQTVESLIDGRPVKIRPLERCHEALVSCF